MKKKFASLIAAAALFGAPHSASAATLLGGLQLNGLPVVGSLLGGTGGLLSLNGLPLLSGGQLISVGGLVPTVLNVALPVVADLSPVLVNLHLPVGQLVPTVLGIALPVAADLSPLLVNLHLPVGQLVPVVTGVALPVVTGVLPVLTGL